MKNITVIITLFLNLCAFGQGVSLDERYGFKNIKFNSTVNDFTGLTYIQSNSGILYYQYEPINIYLHKVFDEDFDTIILGFYNNKLIHIQLQKKIKNEADSKGQKEALRQLGVLKNDFESSLGVCKTSSNDTSIFHFWEENKVSLLISSSLDIKSSGLDSLGNIVLYINNDVIFKLKGVIKTDGY